VADFTTRFNGFWTDKPDADSEVTRRLQCGDITASEAEQLTQFIRDGFLIIPNAISTELADMIRHEMANVHEQGDKFVARTDRQSYNLATREVVESRFMRLIDYYVNSQLARQAIFSPLIARFIQLVFQRPLMAFQSLSFNIGSQQAMHQDGAYVVLSEPLQFVASWIALEDVQDGTGELEYYPGSHRFPDFLFSGEYKHWQPARDGQDQLQAFLAYLNEEAERRGIAKAYFRPKKGDALIWAADLAHGGSRISNSQATRRSLVTHYCPENVLPNYAKDIQFFHKKASDTPDCFYSARHYDLRPIMQKPGQTLMPPAGEILRIIERQKVAATEVATPDTTG